jgi:hypothetical protein
MAAYATTNPPALVSQGIGGPAGSKTFVLVGTHVTTDADAAGFITNAGDLGLKPMDTVILVNNTDPAAGLVHGHVVNTVAAGSPGAGNLSVGVALSTGGTSGD